MCDSASCLSIIQGSFLLGIAVAANVVIGVMHSIVDEGSGVRCTFGGYIFGLLDQYVE